ncbi:hypothetical protein AB1K54_01855 [Microbacterium sp. BWT-B31]|uniref:hypothetical protein n=1 Tax=Microbacterium sp. BWT-B31 TaxID=3232072 RepID=UPI003526C71B
MTRPARPALGALAVVIALALAGCAVPADEAAPEQTLIVTADLPTPVPTIRSARPSPTPMASPTHPADPRDGAYLAEVAAWSEPIPPGYAWPASITGLPAGRFHGKGDWTGYTTAAGIYHCMLVYAAWNAYFVDDDPVASKDYGARADATMPDVPYPAWVTRDDGTIKDQDLASESGICDGFVGELRP